MTVYLPIAELSVNIFIILGMGAAVGFLSGMFGVGGGFLITPLLIFYNIPPIVAPARPPTSSTVPSLTSSVPRRKWVIAPDIEEATTWLAPVATATTGGML